MISTTLNPSESLFCTHMNRSELEALMTSIVSTNSQTGLTELHYFDGALLGKSFDAVELFLGSVLGPVVALWNEGEENCVVLTLGPDQAVIKGLVADLMTLKRLSMEASRSIDESDVTGSVEDLMAFGRNLRTAVDHLKEIRALRL